MRYTPHPAMKKQLLQDLEESRWIQEPMMIHHEEIWDEKCTRKKVKRSRSLHPMNTLDDWEAITPYARLNISDKYALTEGGHSICFQAPCKLEKWTKMIGRIYTVPKAFLHINHENWEDWNRITAMVYPDMPGHRTACVRLQLHNEGTHPVPDSFDREGGHNLNLVCGQWNRISFEIPYVARDEVVGVSIDYDMVGFEPCACSEITWYIGSVTLEEIEQPDSFEGWQPEHGRIAYSHLGYQPGADKTAICAKTDAETFELIRLDDDAVVFRDAVLHMKTTTGDFYILDFSCYRTCGTYYLKVGNEKTASFDISDTVWMDTIWKTINFVFCQRCGFRVPGRHDPCHTDHRVRHNGQEVVANGGWHDAADTNQQIQLTCEATRAFFELAMRVKDSDGLLFRRLMDEGIWGLEYLVSGRFGDGYRRGPSSSAVWTDCIRGTCDDLTFDAVNAPFANLLASSAEALGAQALKREDLPLSEWSLRCAREDYAFGREMLDDPSYNPAVVYPGHDKMVSRCLMYAIAATAAMDLFRLTGEQLYADDGARYGNEVVLCQQRTYLEDSSECWAGFFYRDKTKKTIIHYNHRSQEDKMAMALTALCRLLPSHPDWIRWHSALVYYMAYIKKTMRAVAPYGMLPSGIYSPDEVDDREAFSLMHPIYAQFAGKDSDAQREETFMHYTDQLMQGIELDKKHFLRRFPVWYSFRGNYHVQLSLGKGVSTASCYLNDLSLYQIAQEQFAWIIGKNPFSQSMMFGAGYDYGTQYAVLHGDAVGELPVGMQSNEERDAPFWPQANNCTYKEIWMGPPGKWLAMMADEYLPGHLKGTCAGDSIILVCENKKDMLTITAQNGWIDATVPAGKYMVSNGARTFSLTVVAGGEYDVSDKAPYAYMTAGQSGKTVHFMLYGTGNAVFLTDNLSIVRRDVFLSDDGFALDAEILNQSGPWCAAVLPDGKIKGFITVNGEGKE